MSATRFTMASRCECVKSHNSHLDVCYKAGECICSPCECDCHYVLPMRRIAGQSPAFFRVDGDGYTGLRRTGLSTYEVFSLCISHSLPESV